MMYSVLFVCLGNICRSPAAEGIARYMQDMELDLQQFGVIDSAAIGNWHVGDSPDSRMVRVAYEKGVNLADLRARQIQKKDFEEFDYVVAMDYDRYIDLSYMKPKDSKSKLILFLQPLRLEDQNVPDPYYGNHQDFVNCFNLIYEGMDAFVKALKEGRI
jgi:protein-tyrosine phosphatase